MVAYRAKAILYWLGLRLAWMLLLLAGIAILAVLVYRWINPPTTFLMTSEWIRLGQIEREWIALSQMPDHLPLSAAAAEDANFCRHWGFDLAGIRAALADTSQLRGGSTISQQVAKNVFLWPDRTWTRKGLEAGFTVLIETLWPKDRIMEVYLNVAEFDEGVFGVQAAARTYWSVEATDLGAARAARLMAVLPNPKARSPADGDGWIANRGARIRDGAATLRADGRASCFSVPAQTGAG
ncbi:MAG: monofunctional biosynthetic peptidoglycan transglycosylase [Pseudomonadota bacterium]